ncbi:hypothetical protein SAMN05216344_102164 [Polaromonas sp. OV174]|nr:hypothetical protein SAMN05216344_102164 [Polaromonas sp. OV174]
MQTRTKTGHIKPFGLRMPDDLKKWAMEQAERDRSSLNAWLLRLLDEKREGRSAQTA